MDYEKKYKKALKRAREWYNKTEPDSYTCIVEQIFPELKESEDERIRKELITHCRNTRCVTEEGAERITKWIAWLEKQGSKSQGKSALKAINEQKKVQASLPSFDEQQGTPVVDIEIPFGAKDSELQEASYHIPEGFHAEIQGDMVVIKKGEKKSSWSKEDEDNLTDTCAAIRKFYHRNNGAQDLIDWLKSLKQRCTWKPSEEQIIALRWVLNNIPYNTHKEEISGLLEQIKDL